MPKGVFPRSSEHRKNIGIALRGRRLSAETRHKLSVIASARQLSEEHKAAIGDGQRGAKHHNWKGGVTGPIAALRKTKEYRHWRTAVLARDGGRCRRCRSEGPKLDAHHIFSFTDYPSLRFSVGNGVSLCSHCHTKHRADYRQPTMEVIANA